MKSWPIAAAVIVLVGLPAGGRLLSQEQPKLDTPYVERNRRQFDFYPGGKIDLTAGVPGSVEVQGWDRAIVAIESERIIYYLPQDQAKALSEKYPLRVRYGRTSATIATEGPRESPISMEINLKLYVPQTRTDLKIRVFKGDLAVSRINGWIEANLTQGDVTASSMQGYFSAITKEGDMDVELSGKRWLGQGFMVVSQRGSARLRLPVDFSAALQLETHNGNLTVEYPEQLVEGEKVPLHVVVKDKARRLTATVGDGGAPIKIQTSAGDIHMSGIERP
jgi:hypothetical protein